MPDPTPAPAPADQANLPAPVSETEITARIERARKEEKDKLYSEIEALKAKLETQNQNVSQLQAIQSKLDQAEQQIAALSKARTSTGEVDLKALLQEAQAAVEGKLSAQITELQQALQRKDTEARQQAIAALKQKLIAEANGRIIVALVVGDTEEAIRASVEQSKAEYEKIVATNQVTPGNPAPINPPPGINPRVAVGGGTPPATGLDGFKRTGDTKSFASQRDVLMSSLKTRFG